MEILSIVLGIVTVITLVIVIVYLDSISNNTCKSVEFLKQSMANQKNMNDKLKKIIKS